jgi:hypothetical protein|tara:strand:- start:163 stop:495 length:333 start_codon:yes stop_codon:yes gene_type:complete
MNEKISPYKSLEFLIDNAPKYAEAKANVLYLTEYRKTLKAQLMLQSDAKTEAGKEAYAYAHSDYMKHLHGFKEAVYRSECLRWLMVSAQAKIEVWRSLESSARAEGKSTQ